VSPKPPSNENEKTNPPTQNGEASQNTASSQDNTETAAPPHSSSQTETSDAPCDDQLTSDELLQTLDEQMDES
jgi:hypothetical protein